MHLKQIESFVSVARLSNFTHPAAATKPPRVAVEGGVAPKLFAAQRPWRDLDRTPTCKAETWARRSGTEAHKGVQALVADAVKTAIEGYFQSLWRST